jgi:hypothetical protein
MRPTSARAVVWPKKPATASTIGGALLSNMGERDRPIPLSRGALIEEPGARSRKVTLKSAQRISVA